MYRPDAGPDVIATCPIAIDELKDYQRHPDTFFGIYRKQGRVLDNPIELFDFFYDSYKDTPRERLLELIKSASDFDHFKDSSQKDLAEAVCERWTYNAMQHDSSQRSQNGPKGTRIN